MKTGLILEGGASRTLFTCGVLDVLCDEGIKADYVIGVSAGICSGTSYVSGQRGRNYEVDMRYMHDKRYMGLRHMADRNNKSYYNLKFVFEDIPNIHVPFDFEAFENFDGEVEAAVTNIQTGLAEYLPVTAEDKCFNVLKASCALPILFPPIIINGKRYMDGGIADSIPFERALEKGCEKNIVVLTRRRGYEKRPSKALKLITRHYKKYPEFVRAVNTRYINYNACLKRLWEAEKSGKVFVIAPEEKITCGRTENSPEKLDIMYKMGVRAAMDAAPDLHRYLNNIE